MRALVAFALVTAALAATPVLRAQQTQTAPRTLPPGQARMVGPIKILNVRNNVYLLEGAGGNIIVLAFPEGVTLVDAGNESMTTQVLAAIKTITDKPITYIINTSVRPDHIGGNAKLAESGRQITGGNVTGNDPDLAQTAEVIAHEQVLNRMIAMQPPLPSNAIPETTYHTATLKLSTFYHGDAIELVHPPAAPTDGDTMVWFRQNDVIATGDVFTTTNYPVIDVDRGGSINGEVDALNHILDIGFPEFRLENGTLIVPGHGRICDLADVAYYRDMVTILRDRVQDMVKKGSTLDQVKAARLTRDYDPYFAKNASTYSPDMFIEAAYRSLAAKAAPSARPAAPAKQPAPAPKKAS